MFVDDASAIDYATFFGEQHYAVCSYSGHDHVDGGTSRFDKRGNIYQSVCASCGSCDSFPTFPNPGAWSNTNNSGNCNNAVFKINISHDFVLADFDVPDIGCAPDTVYFNNTSIGAEFIWDSGDGSPVSSDVNPVHIYTQSGIFNVSLIVNDATSCNFSDTVVKQIQILADTSYFLASAHICKGDFLQIGIPPNSDTAVTYTWSPSEGLSDTTVSNPFAQPDTTMQYLLLVSNGICVDSLYQKVNVHNTEVWGGSDTVVCTFTF